MDLEPELISDERIRKAAALEPRAAWGLSTETVAWTAGRVLPGQNASLLALQCLGLYKGAKTLECGSGRGWTSALLLSLGAKLCALEPDLAAWRDLCARMPDSVPLCRSALLDGWLEASPFDRILVSELIGTEPARLREQLADDGRLLYWLQEESGASLWLEVRKVGGIFRERLAFMPMERGPEEIEPLGRP